MSIIAEDNNLSYSVEEQTKKVVQSNDLITSVAKMDKIPYKMFELAVSYIDTANPPKDNIVYLSKEEMFKFFDVTDNDKHSRFKRTLKKLVKEAVFQTRIKGNEVIFAPISYIEWNERSDKVTIEFGKRIMPYLIDLKKNFTQYKISDIKDFQSKYSISIYKWLCMNYNQFERYSFKNTRTPKQLDSYKNPLISMNELRRITDTMVEYKDFRNFEKRVLKKAIEEICLTTKFDITYEKIKKSRSINAIQFHIETKAHWKDEEYKRDDEVAQLSIEQQQQQNQILFAKGVANPYTIKLLTANLITGLDTINQETIIGLSKHVYPLYDELAKLNGEQALTEHLDHVSDKMIDYTSSKKNIVKYLQISAQQYLDDGIGTIVEENKKQRAEEKKITRKKQAKEVPEWSNSNYVETTTDDEKAKFAEWQKNMRKNEE